MHLITLVIFALLYPTITLPQSFTDQSTLIGGPYYSGVCMGVVDMNGDMKDDIVHLDGGNILYVEYQTTPGNSFSQYTFGSVSSISEWGLCVADVDQNGYNDILVGGNYTGVKLLKANALGNAYISTLMPVNGGGVFMQTANFVDIDTDSWVDAFVCDDVADPQKFKNDGSGSFTFDNSLVPTTTVPVSDNSGSYGSVWSDFDNDGDLDLYISKCKQFVTDPADPRRVNMLLQNDGSNNFTEAAAAANIAFGDQSWSADFGDIDNDGDMDLFVVNHYSNSILMENNGNGTFSDITAASGLLDSLAGVFGIQALFRDFDNDGFVDLFFTGKKHRLYHNNGNKTFTLLANPLSLDWIESCALGDLNNDGFVDIYAGYADFFTTPTTKQDRIFFNDGNSNHYLAVHLTGTSSNINGIGAKLLLYGNWGVQVREVRSGESYGIMNSLMQYFGIGSETQIDSLVVMWPSGQKDKITSPGIDQRLNVVETTPLPVVLDFFHAKVENEGVILNWQTSQEVNHDHFVVERSADGYTFEEIGKRLSKSAQSDVCRYSFLDADPHVGKAYYRLKQVDLDGEFIYSGWVEVDWNADGLWQVNWISQTNNDEILLEVTSPLRDVVKLDLLDLNGKHIKHTSLEVKPGSQQVQISVSGLPAGLYLLATHFQHAGTTLTSKILMR